MKGRKFRRGSILHVCQRAFDKGVIFYSDIDRLVHYSTVASIMAKYGIPCYAASIMYTHTHHSCKPESLSQMDACIRDWTSSFARAYNHEYGREGLLFDKPYKKSEKRTLKDIKSNLLYVYNNHVEKKLCRSAVEERWPFLAYADSSHPFSDPLCEGTMSKRLRRALKLVDRRVAKRQPLKYRDVKSVFNDLDQREIEQYIDYVICAYGLVDFSYGIRLYGSFEKLVYTTETVSGEEWEIKEDFYGTTDVPYRDLCMLYGDGPSGSRDMVPGRQRRKGIGRKGVLANIFRMDNDQKMGLVVDCLKYVNVNVYQLARFFHCNLRKI